MKLKPGLSLDYLQATLAHDLDKITPLGGQPGLFVFHSRSNNVDALLQQIAGRSDIIYAEPNHVLRRTKVPNDPNFYQLWGLLNTSKAGADIGATGAWDITTGSTANVAGIVDTGVDYTHPDLAANMWSAPYAFTVTIGGATITCAAGTHGYNAITATCDPMDDNDHGTHVAGTVGATGNNGLGVAGVNWTARLMGLKFMAANGAGDVANAVNVIEFALQAKAIFANTSTPANVRVLSNSWGGTGYSQTLLDEINKANQNDVLFVAAAGNYQQNNDSGPFYPASYNAPNVISVAATDTNDALASFSNYGANSVHLGAPGINVLSTIRGGAYAAFSGTSMATPHVAGAALLVLSRCALGTAALKSTLLSNVDVLSSLSGYTITAGRLNVGRALRACAGSAAALSSTSVSPGTIQSGTGATATVALNGPAGSGGAWVTVSSSNPAAASVPAGVLIPQGASSTTFSVIGGSVSTTTSVTITGTYSGVSQSAVLTVTPLPAPPPPPPPPPSNSSVTFLGADLFTQGNWKSKYGSEGYTLIGDSTVNPGYVTPIPSGASVYTWAASTSDIRALQKPSASDRIAAGWYTGTNLTVDLNFSGTTTHQVAIYCLDWDSYGPRLQTVDILDANNNVLDTHTVANFFVGQYLVWNLGGHVKIRVTNLGLNAVLNGIFFGGAASAPPGNASASFVGTDTGTQGNWKSKYGAEGYTLVGDSTVNPGYVTPVPSGVSAFTWTASTSDVRGLQKANASDRIAAGWYTGTNMTVDLNFSGAATHQVAIYCLDWDNYGPRFQTVDILDANNNVLDTRPVSSFYAGQYLVWNLGGHVKIRVTNLGINAVLSGIFFGGTAVAPPPPPPPPPPAGTGTAAFVGSDTATQGSWKSKYGAEGYNVIGDTAANPPYVTPTPSGQLPWLWAGSTTDVRGLQKANAPDRILGGWYTGTSFTVDLNFTDSATHQVAVYCVDWDNYGPRQQVVDVVDAGNNVLDSRTLTNFYQGQYLVWKLSGHVKIRVTNLAGNAVLNGIFFGNTGSGSPAPGVTFLSGDTNTQGNWKSKYGGEGYAVIGDSEADPRYVTPSPSGQLQWTWASSTTDGRALQKANGSDRIVGGWYTGTSFTVDLNFSDSTVHQVAAYFVDWDHYGPRKQVVDILDANNNVVDTHTLSSFFGGQYLVWSLSGHVKIRVTNLQGNALLNGLFFGGPAAGPPVTGSSASFVGADGATQGNWISRYGLDGYMVIGDSTLNPSYVTPAPAGQNTWTWANSTTDVRGLQKSGSPDRVAAAWFTGTSMTVDLNFTDQQTHQVAVYCVDWDSHGPRQQTVDILDASDNLLDTHTLTSFFSGQYLVWNMSGHVKIRASNLSTSAVVNGIFFR